MKKRRFPTIAVIILVIAIVWLLNEVNILKIQLPWIPIVLIILALGWIINRYSKE